MVNKNHKPSQLRDDQINETARKAIQAANRSAEKLLERKRRLGHKLVIYKDDKVITVTP